MLLWRSCCLITILVAACQGALITDRALFPAPVTTFDFSPFFGSAGVSTQGPLVLNPGNPFTIQFTSTNPDLSTIGSANYDLGVNGRWGGAFAYAALDFGNFGADRYSMTFQFGSPVPFAGAYLNYRVPFLDEVLAGVNYGDVFLEAIGISGSVIEAYNLSAVAPVSTPDALNLGAWRGIERATADIYGLRFSNAGVVITDLTFTDMNSAVPEPSGIWLAAGGLLSMALLAAMRSRRCASARQKPEVRRH